MERSCACRRCTKLWMRRAICTHAAHPGLPASAPCMPASARALCTRTEVRAVSASTCFCATFASELLKQDAHTCSGIASKT